MKIDFDISNDQKDFLKNRLVGLLVDNRYILDFYRVDEHGRLVIELVPIKEALNDSEVDASSRGSSRETK